MELNLKEPLNKLIQEKMQPTEKDRIAALENALTDLAMMIVGVSSDE